MSVQHNTFRRETIIAAAEIAMKNERYTKKRNDKPPPRLWSARPVPSKHNQLDCRPAPSKHNQMKKFSSTTTTYFRQNTI